MIQTQSDGSPITQAFIDAASQPFVGYDVKLYSGGVDTGWGIQRLSIQLGAGASQGDAFEDFALGGLQCSQMDGTLYDVAADPVGSEVELRVGVEVSEGAYEYVTVAHMTVTSAKEWQGITTFTAAGFGFKLNAPLGISGDLSPQQIATAVEAACGVPVALGAFTALPSAIPVGEGATCRRAIEELALRCAGYACETAAGGVMVAPFSSASTCSIREDIITAAPEVGEEWQADGLTVTAAEAEYTYGTGRVKASVPEATQQIADLMWGNITGYAYTPARIRVAVADPRITPFDVMAVPYGQGTVNVPARGIELTCDGGYFGTFSAAGLTAEAEEALVEGEVTRDVRMAKEAAEEAQAVADAVNQHFWTDTQGIHVTEETQDDFLQNPSGANILENANGILLRDGETWLSQFTPGNVAFYDGNGNEAENEVAVFGMNGAVIGRDVEAHAVVTPYAFELADKDGEVFVNFEDMRGADGYATLTEEFTGDGKTTQFYTAASIYQMVSCTVDGAAASPNVGRNAISFQTAPADGAAIELVYRSKDAELKSYTVGTRAGTVGLMSATMGSAAEASGRGSMALGASASIYQHPTYTYKGSVASGDNSIAVGIGAEAEGDGSIAIGNGVRSIFDPYRIVSAKASGKNSIAIGIGTHATQDGEMAVGQFNSTSYLSNKKRVFTIGCGDEDEGESAMVVYIDGNSPRTTFYTDVNVDYGNHSTGTLKAINLEAEDIKAVNDITAGGNVRGDSVIVTTYLKGYELDVQSVADPAAFRAAIGIDYEESTTAADIATAATNFTLNSAEWARYGKVCMVLLNITTANALSTGNYYTVAYMADGKRPPTWAAATLGPSYAVYGNADIVKAGNVRFRPSANVAAGGRFVITATYLLA